MQNDRVDHAVIFIFSSDFVFVCGSCVDQSKLCVTVLLPF